MKEREFNLIEEPWIRVMKEDLQVDTLSLRDTLFRCQEYMDLGGENQPQNFAMLRFLLALTYTVFSRVDEKGHENDISEIADPDEAKGEIFRRWRELWNLGHFPREPFEEYFEKWHDRFWLFDPERPFWQVPSANGGTKYKVTKLISDISESNNKIRFFASRSGEGARCISFEEAARNLLFVNGFDDTSGKKKSEENDSKRTDSIGPGWLGKIGGIQAVGNNLFKTLMLNMVFLKDGEELWEESALPSWEQPTLREKDRVIVPVPDNLPEILTLQSRRMILSRTEDGVTGFNLLGGDFYSKQDSGGILKEQMTVWSESTNVGKKLFSPHKIRVGRQAWRDFGNCFVQCHKENSKANRHMPGIVCWIRTLQACDLIPADMPIQFRLIALEYINRNFSIKDFGSDTLTIFPKLISTKYAVIQEEIEKEVAKCQEASTALRQLIDDIKVASGGDAEKSSSKSDKSDSLFYYAVDIPFRNWLLKIHGPVMDDKSAFRELIDEWEKQAREIALTIAAKEEEKADLKSYVGKVVNDFAKSTKHLYSLPLADQLYKRKIYKMYPKVGDMQ